MIFELHTCFVGCSLLRIGFYGDVCPMCAVPTLPPHSGNVKSSTVRLPCASSSRAMQPNFARTAVLCARPDTHMHAYGIAPRGRGQAFAALHRSCAKGGRLKQGTDSKIAPISICMCVCVYNLDIACEEI